ncbi:hypothetical protein ACHAWF_006195 [Thalassiosira exigua]
MDSLALILVGAFWGCTNPFMRKGFSESKSKRGTNQGKGAKSGGVRASIGQKIILLANLKVWLPYLINQMGSLLYYKTLASSNLTLSVPICNATAMVFSSITSAILGERVNQPVRAALGVILVLSGVAICMYSSEETSGETVVEHDYLNDGEL